jgi:hypothetical protein
MTGDQTGNLSGNDEPVLTVSVSGNHLQPSPRKKPRKQTLTSTLVRTGSDQWAAGEEEEFKRKIAKSLTISNSSVMVLTSLPKQNSNYLRDKPHMSLLTSYRHTWKSRHNHFLRHSDVRARDDPRSTVNELANEKHIMQVKNNFS